MKPESPRVAFLVEGDMDKEVVEGLLARLANEENLRQPQFKTIRLGGSPIVKYFIPELKKLQEQGYEHILLVYDTDFENEEVLRGELQNRLQRAGFFKGVHLVPVTPSIESWLVADEQALAAVAGKPLPGGLEPQQTVRQLFGGKLQPRLIADLLRQVKIAVLRQKEQSFRNFEDNLREVLA